LQVAVGVVKNATGQVLISLRDKALHQGGLWEFPGGKIEANETVEQALARELKEELDITVLATTLLITINHQYPDLAVQ
jgi:8-oxo-dGTP diphosphatase